MRSPVDSVFDAAYYEFGVNAVVFLMSRGLGGFMYLVGFVARSRCQGKKVSL